MHSSGLIRAAALAVLATLTAIGLLLLLVSSADARMQQAPSSRVAIELPDGFEPAQLFSGFTHEALGASFVIVEMPGGAYDGLAQGLTPDVLAARGIVNARRLALPRPDPHIAMQGEQVSPSGTFAKFLVVFRDADVTALITANVQKASLDTGEVKPADIAKALASARIAPAAAPARELFRLGYLGPFKPAGSFLGTARAFTLDGRSMLVPAGSGQPFLIAAPSLDRRPVTQPEAYAEQLMAGLGSVGDVKLTRRAAITYGGLSGIEIEATAREREGAGEVLLYQIVLLAREGGYFRIFGQAPLAEKERWLAEFRRIAEGFSAVP